MPAWVLHDLRRTMRTRLDDLDIDFFVAEMMIAHVRTGVHGIYNRNDLWTKRCVALARWTAHLEQIVAGTSGTNVVALKAPALAS
jgi:hypothetical protein